MDLQNHRIDKWFVWKIIQKLDTQGGAMPFAVPDIETDLQCHHIQSPTGQRCGSPAMRGEYYCYHHHIKHANRTDHRVLIDPEITRMEIPVLEDRASIFTAMAAVIHRLADNTIDTRRSGQMLYGLQALLRALPPEPSAATCQTGSPSDAGTHTTPSSSAHPERAQRVEGLQEASSADAARTTPPPGCAHQPANPHPPTPPKTINITKDSLIYFLRSRHCYNCNAQLFPAEELTERPHSGAPPEVIEEARPALPPQVHEDIRRERNEVRPPTLPSPSNNEDAQNAALLPSLHAVAGPAALGQRVGHGKALQAKLKPLRASGRLRIRLPVASKTALVIAGSAGGREGSPRPVGPNSLMLQNSSISGC